MRSTLRLLGHPVHPMLVVFPLGLLITSVVFDGLYYFGTSNSKWALISYWLIAAGLLGGLLAAVTGWIDWFGIPAGTRAKTIGIWHGVGNGIGVLGPFAVSWLLRRENPESPPVAALVFSFVGCLVGLVTAWLGGELVNRMGVGVDPGAHVNSPSSLSGRSANEIPVAPARKQAP